VAMALGWTPPECQWHGNGKFFIVNFLCSPCVCHLIAKGLISNGKFFHHLNERQVEII
jgi:hypothetical protein